ncbi:hypothetical protein H4R19_000930 [Coemansia spiralis]|nr:hypothetical protein H4R19_000930 [Coemansia spiralis]
MRLLAVAALVCAAYAHVHIRNLIIDGKVLDRGQCIRPYQSNFNFPVKGTDNKNIVCRTTSMTKDSTSICDIKAGSKLVLEFHEEESRASRAIEGKHYGPSTVALSPLDANGAGNVWFYIYKQGYDPATKKWCIDHLNANKGQLEVTIPADIADGEYLMRGEIIALHLAEKVGGAEFYPNCAQIRVSGGGSSKPKGFALPGVYQPRDKGIFFNLYDGYKSYPMPGPDVYKAGAVAQANGADGETSGATDKEVENVKTNAEDDPESTKEPSPSPSPKGPPPETPCSNRRRRRMQRARGREL